MPDPMNPPPLDEEILEARELLALGPGANRAEIMSAWRIAARMTHPDTVSPDAVDIATRMSQRVNEARDLLLSLLPTVLDDAADDDVPGIDDPPVGGPAATPTPGGRPGTTVSPVDPSGSGTGDAAGARSGTGDAAAESPPPPPPPPKAAPPRIPVEDNVARAPVPGAAPGSVFGRPSPSASRPSAPKFAESGGAAAAAPNAASAGAAGAGDVPPPPAQPAPQMPRGLHTVIGGTTEIDSAMSSSAGLPRPRPIRTTTRDGAAPEVPVAGDVNAAAAPTPPLAPTAPTAPTAPSGGVTDAAAAAGTAAAAQPQIDPEVLAAAAARRAAPQRPAARPGAEVRRPDRKALAKKRAEEKKAGKARKKPKGVQFDEDGKPILTKGSGLNSTTALLMIVLLLGGGVLAWQYGLLDQYLSSTPDDPVLAAVEAGEVVPDPAAPPVAAPDPSGAVGLAVSAVSVGDPTLLAGVVAPDVRQEQLAEIVKAFVPAAEDQEIPAAVKAQLTCTDPAQPTATCTVPAATGIELAEPIDLVATPQGWRIVGLASAPAQP